jgi:hypothetical protein
LKKVLSVIAVKLFDKFGMSTYGIILKTARPHMAQAGIQQGQVSRATDNAALWSRFAGDVLTIRIPACAGMTG